MKITPAAGHLGAVVTDLDLCALSSEELTEIHSAIAEFLVLVFPGQGAMDDAKQVEFALEFGGPYIHPIARALGAEFKAGHIVDDRDHPPFQDKWHTDVSWDPEPPTFGTLRMIELPDRGGDTVFVSTYAAYDALSDAMKRALEGLTAIHTMGTEVSFRSKSGDGVIDEVEKQFSGAEHPVVGVHPVTGRKYLNVNREFTDHIVQMSRAESDAILEFLHVHCMNPNFALRWSWTVGDVVLWDERPTLHFAVADYWPQRREIVRVNVR